MSTSLKNYIRSVILTEGSISQLATLRSYVRNRILLEAADDVASSFNDDVWGFLQQMSEKYKFEPELLGPASFAARFNSSSVRDSEMQNLMQDISGFVTDKYSGAKAESVNVQKHSRDVLRLINNKEKITIAFKAPSTGQAGLDFETVLFTVLKNQSGTSLSASDKKRISKVFGISEKLKDEQYSTLLDAMIQDPPPAVANLVNRANDAATQVIDFFGGVFDAKMKGGQGGKGDLEIKTPEGVMDLSLKHEKKAGTNVYEFNKDLGDGTKSVTVGREPLRFSINFIESSIPWWQVARQQIINQINASEAATLKKSSKDFAPELTEEEKQDFINNPASKSVMKVKSVASKIGGDAEKAAATVLQQAFDKFAATLASLDVDELSSLIEESRLGSTSQHPLWKMTSSPAGTTFKRVAGNELPSGATASVERSGSTLTASIKNVDGEVLSKMVVRGLKFRSSVYSASLSDLSIKTRA